jgi:hypothetical protein
MAATSRSTTTITITRTTISTVTLIVRDKVIGSTIRNTAGMRHTVIEELRTNLVAMLVSSRDAELADAVVSGEPVVPAGLAEPVDRAGRVASEELVVQAAPEALEASVALAVPEDLAVRAVLAELADQGVPAVPAVSVAPGDQVVLAELELGPVAEVAVPSPAAAPALVPAAGELEHDPVAVPVQGHQLAQVAVPAEIRLVIAAHPHGLRLLGVADLAVAAVETTREPVAAGAVAAWGAAA